MSLFNPKHTKTLCFSMAVQNWLLCEAARKLLVCQSEAAKALFSWDSTKELFVCYGSPEQPNLVKENP